MSENANKSTFILLGGVIAALLGLIVVLLVKNEGDKTRDAIKEGISEAADDTSKDLQETVRGEFQDGLQQGMDMAVGVQAEDPESAQSSLQQFTEKLTGRSGDDAGNLSELPEELSTQFIARLDGLLKSDSDAAGGENAKESGTRGALGGFLDIAEGAVRTADKVASRALGGSEEKTAVAGQEIDEIVKDKFPLFEDERLLKRIRSLSRSLVDPSELTTKEFHFAVLDASTPCAFAAPGGFIYLSKGMTDFASADEELQFVVGCQMARLESGQTESGYRKAVQKLLEAPADPESSRAKINLLSMGNSVPNVEDDYFVDQQVYSWMSGIGRTQEQSLAYLRKAAAAPPTNGAATARIPGTMDPARCQLRLTALEKHASSSSPDQDN